MKIKRISKYFTMAALFLSSALNAGTLIKLDLSSYENFAKILENAKVAYHEKYGDNFLKSSFEPSLTLLFLSAQNDDSDLNKIIDSELSGAQLVYNAAQTVADNTNIFEISSKLEITHTPGVASGVPSVGIVAGEEYCSVNIILPDASAALNPLMQSLKEEVMKVIERTSARDYPFRAQINIGYIKNHKEAAVIENFEVHVNFSVDSFIVDFPNMPEYKNKILKLKN
jgi:hypothetical protein